MDKQIAEVLDLADAGKWHASHDVVARIDTPEAAWVHANLHREEGDLGNAAYWYRRAGQPVSDLGFAEERQVIRKALA